jgi:hypothetical protein
MKIARSLHTTLTLLFVFLIIFETTAYIATTPKPQKGFFQLYALGADGLATDYYPNNSSFIQPGERVSWYIGVSNQMGKMQFVDIVVRLGNQSYTPPNDTTASPSNMFEVVDFQRFLQNNETWEVPFVWETLNVTTQNGYTSIIEMQIGNSTYAVQKSASCLISRPCNMRFIFELWTWDTDSDNFQYGWENGNQTVSAWLQLWFTPTVGAP